MKDYLLFLGICIALLFLNSCGMVNRFQVENPAAEKKDHQVLVTEYFRTSQSENEIQVDSATVKEQGEIINSTHDRTDRQPVVIRMNNVPDDDTLVQESTDDEISNSEMLAEAVESERVARKAVAYSFLPFLIWIFPPLYIIGIIITIIQINRFNRYTYVTEKGLKNIHTAKIVLLISSLLPVALVLLIILAILYL
jgi:ATP-dependent Zn protease